jgi:hypothetical protein
MDAERILIGTGDGLRTPTTTLADGIDVVALAPAGDGAWWAIDGGRSLVRIGDGRATSVAPIDGLVGRSVVDHDGEPLVGTSEARLLRLDGDRLEPIEGFDAAEGRDDWFTPWGGPPDTRSLARDPQGLLFANVHVGGILRTDGLHATYARAVAVAGSTLLVSASRGPRGGQAAIYRAPIAGGTFERCEAGLPGWFDSNIDSHWLAAGQAGAAFGTADGGVFASDDEGDSWTQVAEGIASIRCLALAPE